LQNIIGIISPVAGASAGVQIPSAFCYFVKLIALNLKRNVTVILNANNILPEIAHFTVLHFYVFFYLCDVGHVPLQ